MKFGVLFLVITCGVSLWAETPAAEESRRGKQLIREALTASANASYIARLPRADPHSRRNLPGLLYRRVDERGGVCKRLELSSDSQRREIYLVNDTGQYGTTGDDWVKIEEVLILSHWDNLFQPLTAGEFMVSLCRVEEVNYRNVACYQITQNLASDVNLIASISSLSVTDAVTNLNSTYHKLRPVKRIFLIGKENHLIYSRTHYNRFGRKLLDLELGDVDLTTPIDPQLFVTPEKITRHARFRKDFLSPSQELPAFSEIVQTKVSSGTAAVVQWLRQKMISWLPVLLLAVGGVALAGAYWLRRRMRQR